MKAYLQHGRDAGPFQTESVEVKEVPLAWQLAGKTWTATGYGEKIPTRYMIRHNNKWRRVYCYCISNSGTLFIGRNLRTGIIVDIDR